MFSFRLNLPVFQNSVHERCIRERLQILAPPNWHLQDVTSIEKSPRYFSSSQHIHLRLSKLSSNILNFLIKDKIRTYSNSPILHIPSCVAQVEYHAWPSLVDCTKRQLLLFFHWVRNGLLAYILIHMSFISFHSLPKTPQIVQARCPNHRETCKKVFSSSTPFLRCGISYFLDRQSHPLSYGFHFLRQWACNRVWYSSLHLAFCCLRSKSSQPNQNSNLFPSQL